MPEYDPNQKVVYLAGPYRSNKGSHGIKMNINAAELVAIELWNMGFAVICPHLNTAFLDGSADDNTWLKGDLAMIARCHAVVMMPLWKDSGGSREEHEHAKKYLIPVYYYPDDTERLKSFAKRPFHEYAPAHS